MKNLIQDTLNKIKKEHIAPEPRWKFLSRKIGVWIGVIAVVALAALVISVVYFLLAQLDWEIYPLMHQNMFVYGLSVMPYFWLTFLGVLALLAFLAVRKTENGYRFNWLLIVSSIAIGILAIGFFISRIGWGGRLNGVMMHQMPYYAQNVATKEKQWMQPEKGFLAGTIRAVSGSALEIDDLNSVVWNIQLTKQTLVRPSVTLAQGQMIKIIGTRKDAQNFSATEIRPWMGQGMMGADR
ncbi:MAG: hypothetical protein UT50_C0027G0007 [Candidatus Moranbacteria bacterium GW2011_GWA2_39_41]|nr:MAG: hypothetical protein UT50_C0027G0007 [Candidatus Moranbacteria bacterium GW2011_GWA2_39_41]